VTDWATGRPGRSTRLPARTGGHTNRAAGVSCRPARGVRPVSICWHQRSPLPPFRLGGYDNNLPLSADSTLVAVCTDTVGAERYYALVKLGRPDAANGTVAFESWFQVIKGLRLIQH